jgi:hypothetical protein
MRRKEEEKSFYFRPRQHTESEAKIKVKCYRSDLQASGGK